MVWIIVTIAVIILAAVGFYTYKLFSFNESVINERKQLKHQKINLKQSIEKAQFDNEHIQKLQGDVEHYRSEQEKLIQTQIEFLNLREQKIAQKEDEIQHRMAQFEDEKISFFQRLQGKEFCLNNGLVLLDEKYKMLADSTQQLRQQQQEMNDYHRILDKHIEKLTQFFDTTEHLIEDLEFEKLMLLKEKNLLESAKNDFINKKQELAAYEANLNSQFQKIEDTQHEIEQQQSLLFQRTSQIDKEKSEIQDRLNEFDTTKQTVEAREEKIQKEFKELTLERSRLLKQINELEAREKELAESARKLENWGQELVNKEREMKKWENQLQAKERELDKSDQQEEIDSEKNLNNREEIEDQEQHSVEPDEIGFTNTRDNAAVPNEKFDGKTTGIRLSKRARGS